MKWEKEVNKIVIECWIKSEPSKRKYQQGMKKIWDEVGVCPVTEQRLVDQARQIRVTKSLTDTEMEEIDRRCRDIIHEEETGDSTDNGGSREEEQGAQGNGIDQQHVMEIQVDTDQECTGKRSMGQNGEQQEVQSSWKKKKGTRCFQKTMKLWLEEQRLKGMMKRKKSC